MKFNQLGSITAMIIVLTLICIPSVSAQLNPFGDKKVYEPTLQEDMSNFVKEGFNAQYGVIRISNTFFWIETSKVAEYSLINTKEGIFNLEMDGRATLYSKGTLFDDVSFKDNLGRATTLRKGSFYIKVTKDNFVDVPDVYEKVCSPEEIQKDGCKEIIKSYKRVNQPLVTWEIYNGEDLTEGDYEWKFIGQRSLNQKVDIIPVKSGMEFIEW